LHRLALASACWATVLSLSGCRTYENITEIYTEEGPSDGAASGGRDSGRPPANVTGGSGGAAGTGGSAGTGGNAGSGSGGSAGSADAMPPPSTDGSTVVPPTPDGPPPATPDAPLNLNLNMGLVSRWKLDEGTGTLAADSSGTGNGGMISGAAWQPAGFPGAKYANPASLRFDGVDDYVELSIRNLPANNRAQTVSLWVNHAAAPPATGRAVFVSLTAGTSGSSRLKVGFSLGKVGAWKSGTPGDLALANPPAPGWHHYAYSYDGTTHRVFIDGTMAAMSTVAPDTGAVLRGRLGTNYDSSERFAGQIDEVRIYNRALTPAEIGGLAGGYE
jgi:hypothetical protein